MALERPDFHREGQRFDSVILHNIIQRLPGSVIYIDIKIKKEETPWGTDGTYRSSETVRDRSFLLTRIS